MPVGKSVTDPKVLLPSSLRGDARLSLLPAGSSVNGSLHATHYSLQFQGLSLHGAVLSLLEYRYGNLVQGYLPQITEIETQGIFPTANTWFCLSESRRWIPAERRLQKLTDAQGWEYVFYDAQGKIAGRETLTRYASRDTMVKAWVFRPDPLSSANILYGGNIRDAQDSSSGFLDNQLFLVDLHARKNNDSLILDDDLIRFAEISDPKLPGTWSSGDFYFSRDQPGFEDVMVAWHLRQLRNWWDTLGYGNYADTVLIDAHAYNGSDESGFTPLPGIPTIEFGTGGVDDAEDGDSPVHEYTHAAFNHMCPNSYVGTQRQSVEEGICDFMALAYSLRYTTNQSDWVYQWDGHNEFWPGRNLRNNKIFPSAITNQIHVDGEIFGAALYELAREIGMDSTVKLVMGTIPMLMPALSMPQCAALVLRADSLINGGVNRWPIIKAFYPKGLLPAVGVKEIVMENNFIVKNSEGFADGSGELLIFAKPLTQFRIIDPSGRVVKTFNTGCADMFSVNPAEYKAGMYILSTDSMNLIICRK